MLKQLQNNLAIKKISGSTPIAISDNLACNFKDCYDYFDMTCMHDSA